MSLQIGVHHNMWCFFCCLRRPEAVLKNVALCNPMQVMDFFPSDRHNYDIPVANFVWYLKKFYKKTHLKIVNFEPHPKKNTHIYIYHISLELGIAFFAISRFQANCTNGGFL